MKYLRSDSARFRGLQNSRIFCERVRVVFEREIWKQLVILEKKTTVLQSTNAEAGSNC